VCAGLLAQVDHLVGGLLDAQPLGQGGRQQQARIGDGVDVVKAGVELVEGVGGCHRESALLIGIRLLSQAPFSQVRGPFS